MWTMRYCAEHVGLERQVKLKDALNLSSAISQTRIDVMLAYDRNQTSRAALPESRRMWAR